MSVEILRGSTRFTDREAGRMTWHSFSFGAYYDPERVGLGPMVCHDEHLLADGHGFATHRHRGVDIVTWVVSGALAHTDSHGGSATLTPGSAGILSTGAGIEHSEIAAAPQTRFVQVWIAHTDTVVPDADPGQAAYAVRPVTPPAGGGFTGVAGFAKATFSVARLAAGETITLPEGRLRHLYVASGGLLRNSLAEPLQAGDAFVLRGPADPTGLAVTAAVPTELLLWQL